MCPRVPQHAAKAAMSDPGQAGWTLYLAPKSADAGPQRPPTEKSAARADRAPTVQDIWMHCIVLVVSLATAGVGIARLVMEEDFKQVQTMSILVRPSRAHGASSCACPAKLAAARCLSRSQLARLSAAAVSSWAVWQGGRVTAPAATSACRSS